ncbi:hypothetical protein HOD08_02935 [bacterium]|nr:hypothetical protein [bacterium]
MKTLFSYLLITMFCATPATPNTILCKHFSVIQHQNEASFSAILEIVNYFENGKTLEQIHYTVMGANSKNPKIMIDRNMLKKMEELAQKDKFFDHWFRDNFHKKHILDTQSHRSGPMIKVDTLLPQEVTLFLEAEEYVRNSNAWGKIQSFVTDSSGKTIMKISDGEDAACAIFQDEYVAFSGNRWLFDELLHKDNKFKQKIQSLRAFKLITKIEYDDESEECQLMHDLEGIIPTQGIVRIIFLPKDAFKETSTETIKKRLLSLCSGKSTNRETVTKIFDEDLNRFIRLLDEQPDFRRTQQEYFQNMPIEIIVTEKTYNDPILRQVIEYDFEKLARLLPGIKTPQIRQNTIEKPLETHRVHFLQLNEH